MNWREWLYQNSWMVVLAFLLLLATWNVYVIKTSPSDSLTPGHCYRVDARPGLASIAGFRYSEIPCPS